MTARGAEKRFPSGPFSLDYVSFDNADEIDQGIRLSILAIGIGPAKIKTRGLYPDLNYHSMTKYIESLYEEYRMERSVLHNRLYIGETYLKYRNKLEKIGFSDEDGSTKLPWGLGSDAFQKKDGG